MFRGLKQRAFTTISDHRRNYNNMNIVSFSQYSYCGVNNTVLTLFVKRSKFDVLLTQLFCYIRKELYD